MARQAEPSIVPRRSHDRHVRSRDRSRGDDTAQGRAKLCRRVLHFARNGRFLADADPAG
jgi:hypothetical protein